VGKAWELPAFKEWEKETAALPAEEQVKAVSTKLVELNPGFDGTVTGWDGSVTPKIVDGVVTNLAFVTDEVTDISPVRALVGLKWLACAGSTWQKPGSLSDLSPLHGMKLTRLACQCNAVVSLLPLEGMQLNDLICGSLQFSDLSPLKGMPLTNLDCQGSQVSDLSALKGMKLTSLGIQNTQVGNLSPLQGMPLTMLMCHATKVSDLSALKGTPLKVLNCALTPISDLSPLHGMELDRLDCFGTQVSDLSPLKEMPLKQLICNDTSVTDLSPLKGIELKEVGFTPKNITQGIDVLRQMKSLSVIWAGDGQFPPAEFWKKYDASDFGKPDSRAATLPAKSITTYDDPAFKKWAKEVAALPAEEQVKAVVKKLQELNPGFDGKVTGWNMIGTPNIENGVVTELSLLADNVTDISPVRALAGLRRLQCGGPFTKKGKLADLSPLVGMQLIALDFSRSNVSDLLLIKSLPTLKELVFADTPVSDLAPLRGMALTALGCQVTAVADLSPLKGMALTKLELFRAKVSDLSPLRGMPLRIFDCSETAAFDLTPLDGMALSEITLTPKNIAEGLNAIRQMKSLKTLQVRWDTDKLAPAEFWKKYDAGDFGKPDANSKPPGKPVTSFKDPAFKKLTNDVTRSEAARFSNWAFPRMT
jgi:Leucine-rich repeat (LRR) protein